MKLCTLLFILISIEVSAQGNQQLTPIEMSQMRNSLDNMEINKQQQQQSASTVPSTQPAPPLNTNLPPAGSPPNNNVPGNQNNQATSNPPVGSPSPNPPGNPNNPNPQNNPNGQNNPSDPNQNPQNMPPNAGQGANLNTIPNPPPLSPEQDKAQKELMAKANVRNKSPFMIPTELFLRIKRALGEKASNSGQVDTSIEVRRRWPVKDYNLVGVIWRVKNPKAMISDREGRVHIFKLKDYIANAEGYISEINNGEVIIVERGAEIKLELKSGKK